MSEGTSGQNNSGWKPVWHRAPVTTVFVCVQVVMFLVVEIYAQVNRGGRLSAARDFGVVTPQVLVSLKPTGTPEEPKKSFSDVSGPFDLWSEGPLLIPLAALHHAGEHYRFRIVHLLADVFLLLVFGGMLERRIGWWKYLLFLLGAILVSMPPEYLLGQLMVQGSTGVVFAAFAALWMLRRHDADLRIDLREELRPLIFVFLLMLPAARVAFGSPWPVFCWVFGWAFGLVFVKAVCQSQFFRWEEWLWRVGLVALCTGAGWMMYAAASPTWLGKYHAFRAFEIARQDDTDPRVAELLEQAVTTDPELKQVWRDLIDWHRTQMNWDTAWKHALRAVSHHRSNNKLIELATIIWPHVRDKTKARELLSETFPRDTDEWERKLIGEAATE